MLVQSAKLSIAILALLALASCSHPEAPQRIRAPRESAATKDSENAPAGKLPVTAPRNIATH